LPTPSVVEEEPNIRRVLTVDDGTGSSPLNGRENKIRRPKAIEENSVFLRRVLRLCGRVGVYWCATVTAFWGGANEKLAIPGYSNPNNHSVVLRFEFGQASFLVMGDLEANAAKDMLDHCDENTEVFDADVLQLG
jgi:hypothetical protein